MTKNTFSDLILKIFKPVSLAGLCGLLLFFSAITSTPELSQKPDQAELRWQEEEIGTCVLWKYYHGEDLFDSKQSINLIEADLNCAGIQTAFAWSDSVLIKTSEFATEHNALAALNGSYFDVNEGGSVVFFKTEGEIIARGAVNRRLYSENGAIAIGENGTPSIIPRPDDGWLTAPESTLLGSGPLLILNEEEQNLNNDAFNRNRHPRTAVGITDDNRVLFVTVDGRSAQAYGMTTPELTGLFKLLGAVSALNLDGGGSTTMWIRDKGEAGIVNYPSDNLQFDREGERGVANVLLILPADQ